MKKIEKVILNEEEVFLRKSFLGWKVIYPIRNEDGSINLKNLIAGGNWWKLIGIGILVFLIIMSIIEYSTAVRTANECLNKTNMYQIILN